MLLFLVTNYDFIYIDLKFDVKIKLEAGFAYTKVTIGISSDSQYLNYSLGYSDWSSSDAVELYGIGPDAES